MGKRKSEEDLQKHFIRRIAARTASLLAEALSIDIAPLRDTHPCTRQECTDYCHWLIEHPLNWVQYLHIVGQPTLTHAATDRQQGEPSRPRHSQVKSLEPLPAGRVAHNKHDGCEHASNADTTGPTGSSSSASISGSISSGI